MDYVVVVVEVGSIQKYIFNSNRLRENLGASYLVNAATHEWAFDAVNTVTGSHNLLNSKEIDPKKAFEKDNLDIEVIYSGGGNFVAIFRHNPDGERFTVKAFGRALSERVITEAPGLQLQIGISDALTWGQGLLQKTIGDLRKELKNRVMRAPRSMPLLGLGVTVACRSTGLAAVAFDDDGPYSAEIGAKLAAAKAATTRLHEAIPLTSGKFVYTDDLDKLGRSEGDTSYIAVVHADGNGIGAWLASQIRDASNDREYICLQREASNKLAELSTIALQRTIPYVEELAVKELNRAPSERKLDFARFIENNDKKASEHKWCMPIRPIVFGGDDLTVVCDGRIGVSFAKVYLREFESAAAAESLNLTASAGTAIVKVHYPFARAYKLSEELVDEAKRLLRQKNLSTSTMDWHLAMSGISGDLDEIREREYAGNTLSVRPVQVSSDGTVSALNSWENVETSINAFCMDWEKMRSKTKALRDAIREGDDMVTRFQLLFGADKSLPEVTGASDDRDKHRVYFDALELADRYVSIEQDALS